MIGYLYLQLEYGASKKAPGNLLKGAFARFKHRKKFAGKA
jgi:hypothetical protein